MAAPPPEDAPESEFPPEDSGPGGPPGSATSDSRELPAFFDPYTVPTTVHVVETDPLYRRIFSRTLDAAGLDVREYGSATEFLSAVGPDEAGCLLVATGSSVESSGLSRSGHAPRPDMPTADLLLRLAANRSPLAAVAVTAGLPLDPALSLLRRGAVDVLEKPVKRTDLVTAVREALSVSGGRRDRRRALLRLALLSERQYRLLGLLASSWPLWIIALRFGVRRREVVRGGEELARVLGVRSTAEAIEVYRDAVSRASRNSARPARYSGRRRDAPAGKPAAKPPR